jgi:hypothetical protein
MEIDRYGVDNDGAYLEKHGRGGEYVKYEDHFRICIDKDSEIAGLNERIAELEKNQVVWHDAEKEIPGDTGEYMTVDESGIVSWDEFEDEENTFLSGGNIKLWAELPQPPKNI